MRIRAQRSDVPTNVALPRFIFDSNLSVINRGGVEDTRLETKAKNKKKCEAKVKDSPSEDRPSRGQGQRPKTQVQVFSKKKSSNFFSGNFQKKDLKKGFRAISKERGLQTNFLGHRQNFNNSKNSAVLEPRTGQFSRT